MKRWWRFTAGALCVVVAACSGRTMEVIEPSIVAPAGDAPGVMYFFIHNGTGVADTLLGVTTGVARRAELHREMVGMHDTTARAEPPHVSGVHDMANMAGMSSMTTMAPVERIPIRNGETLNFVPGGYHVMLIQPRALRRGEAVPVTFRFARAGNVQVTAHVIGYADVDRVLFITADSTMSRN